MLAVKRERYVVLSAGQPAGKEKTNEVIGTVVHRRQDILAVECSRVAAFVFDSAEMASGALLFHPVESNRAPLVFDYLPAFHAAPLHGYTEASFIVAKALELNIMLN